MDNSYNTLFDSDLAEHEFIMSQPVKSPKTCAECAYSTSECDDVECHFCRQFDKAARRCRCTTVQAGERCKFFERRTT